MILSEKKYIKKRCVKNNWNYVIKELVEPTLHIFFAFSARVNVILIKKGRNRSHRSCLNTPRLHRTCTWIRSLKCTCTLNWAVPELLARRAPSNRRWGVATLRWRHRCGKEDQIWKLFRWGSTLRKTQNVWGSTCGNNTSSAIINVHPLFASTRLQNLSTVERLSTVSMKNTGSPFSILKQTNKNYDYCSPSKRWVSLLQ